MKVPINQWYYTISNQYQSIKKCLLINPVIEAVIIVGVLLAADWEDWVVLDTTGVSRTLSVWINLLGL